MSKFNHGALSYNADSLAVWNKNVDFMREPRFLKAYQAGMNTDHRLDRRNPERIDINIEWRIAICCWAAWHAQYLEGDFVECGTNTGIMSVAICNYIDFANLNKKFYLFDTYMGIPREQIRQDEQHAHEQNAAYRDVHEIAKQNFAAWPNAILVKGKIPDTLLTHRIDKVAYLMIDMNIVEPERMALNYFLPKVVRGGIVLFDDYGWSGYHLQKEAHDETATSYGLKIMNLPTGQGMLIKP
jgi:O-methyltransferase